MSNLFESFGLSTWFFIIVISLFFFFFHNTKNERLRVQGASILTSIGILGTFFGIIVGLLNFNQNDIQQSVPELLSGLKVAFVSSFAGLVFAISLKFENFLEKLHEKKKISTGATINDLHSELIQLNKSFHDFSKNIVQSNSDALIEALKSVINDFNTKINEQFGENFKKLNEAVGKLLVWQENYKSQLEKLIEVEKETVEEMSKASSSYHLLIESSQNFTEIANSLGSLIMLMDSQKKSMESSIEAFSHMIDNVKDGLPGVSSQIEQLSIDVHNSVKQNSELMKLTLDSTSNEIKDINEKTKNQVGVLDQSLQKELTKAMEIFGKQLAALSEKFANDYTPLTERLREILEIAKVK